ncbi:zinc metalloproteinase nas-6-like [Pocillopora damicornis]|uniref:zinc metalloproteinase nas-6-like n=1 Tax=Pocillopora damicornis TaxID=46731 RepID=UPI000F550220|nr:zinc metalloproteinase nas-6-like [Pocillopora damicornis]
MIYTIDRSLSVHARARRAIRAGMRQWTRRTCVRFRRRRRERAYVRFVRGSGCSSFVGRTGRRQDINLHPNCWTTGILAHEIGGYYGHALGFYHEQSRPDKDDFVKILWGNIIDKKKFNFKKYLSKVIDSLGTKHGFKSIMHQQEQNLPSLPRKKGCSSKIGRHDEPQSVNLGNGCWSMGTVAHELGTCVGFLSRTVSP